MSSEGKAIPINCIQYSFQMSHISVGF